MKQLAGILFCFYLITGAMAQSPGRDTLLFPETRVKRINPASIYLPLEPHAYHSIDRVDIIGLGNYGYNLLSTTKPLTVNDLIKYYALSNAFEYRLEVKKRQRLRRKRKGKKVHIPGPDEVIPEELDWIYSTYNFNVKSKKAIFKSFYRHPAHFFHVFNKNFRLSVNPVLHLTGGVEAGGIESNTQMINTRGAQVWGRIAERLSFYTYFTDTQANFPSWADWNTGASGVFPGEGRVKNDSSSILNAPVKDFSSAQGYIAIRPLKQIDVQFGHGKNFIGNGHRSLFLSNHAHNYMFLKLNTRVWRVNYQNLFTEFMDYTDVNTSDQKIPRKYAAFHHLDFQILPNLNVGIFEGVIYGKEDSLQKQDFNLQYLNPIIFYRSVEYHAGSVDNVLLGLDWKYNFLHHFQFYGQILLDEFKFNEVVNQTGWWANKYGYQLGLKYIDVAGIRDLDVQMEYNQVRPFTYSHNRARADYTHMAQPLAHPMGANFREVIGIMRYRPLPRWFVVGKLVGAQIGLDPENENLGQNIYKNNAVRTGGNYDNELLQGLKTSLINASLKVSFLFRPNLYLEAGFTMRHWSHDQLSEALNRQVFSLGMRMNALPRFFDY